MATDTQDPASLQDEPVGLICPACKAPLPEPVDDRLRCVDCGREYPLIGGVPILICDERSLFSVADYRQHKTTTMDLREEAKKYASLGQRLKHLLVEWLPDSSLSVSDFDVERAVAQAAGVLQSDRLRILVIGAGDAQIDAGERHDIRYTDVAVGALTDYVADAHDLPFADHSFDLVISVAVLEHVLDPFRVVAEIGRVLQPRGLVYAVTPFMQQVHMGRYDFMRFSPQAHRWLFRDFEQLQAGTANGPGMALAWSIEYYFGAFARSQLGWSLLRNLGRLLGWPFKFADYLTRRNRGTFMAGSAFYFFGRKADAPLDVKDMTAVYQGW